MPLLITYSKDQKERSTYNIVELTKDFGKFPILKSTDTNLPEGLSFKNDDGSLKDGVKEQDDIFGEGKVQFASVLKIVTTADQIRVSKLTTFKTTAENEIKAISGLAEDATEQKQAIVDKHTAKVAEIGEAVTIPDLEDILWT